MILTAAKPRPNVSSNKKRRLFPLLVFLLALSAPGATEEARAHGTGWQEQPPDDSVAVRFFYSDGTPMAYSEISVFSPSDPGVAYQKARTDRSGWFVFRPTEPGFWKFGVNDGQGHLAEGEIEVPADTVAEPVAAAAAETPANAPAPAAGETVADAPLARPRKTMASGGAVSSKRIEAALGLSVILNFALLALLFRKRNKEKTN
jgi:nickel transport protein